MIQTRRFARWKFRLWPVVAMVLLATGAGNLHASRSTEPEPVAQQRLPAPSPSPSLTMDSSMLQAATLPVEVAAEPRAEMASVPSDTNKVRPLPGSGLPNSESGWPGLLGFSFEAAAVLVFSLGLMLSPFALGGFFAFALFLAWVGHYFAILGMKPTRRHRNFALLACAFWGVIRAVFAAFTIGGLGLFAIFF